MLENRKRTIFPIISIAVFLMVLVLPTAIWGIGTLILGDSFQTLDFDLGENRKLASFPEEITPDYGTKLEAYYNDRLPFRSLIISTNRSLTAAMENPYDKVISPYLVNIFYNSSNKDLGSQNGGGDFFPPKLYNDMTIQGRDGWLFFAKENSLEDYLGSNVLTEEEMQVYLDNMIKLQEICTSLGKEVYFILPPNKEQVYSELMPDYKIVNEYKRLERLFDYIKENSNLKISYPMEELQTAKENYQIYFKTDTHWNHAGAFIGVQALYSLMGMPVTDLDSLSPTPDGFDAGDLIGMGNLNKEDYTGDIYYQINYKPDITVTALNDTTLADWIYSTSSTSPNKKHLTLVGDSFRMFMSEFLAKDFSQYTHVHWNYLEESAAIEAIKDADVLIIESVERLNDGLIGTLTRVYEILNS